VLDCAQVPQAALDRAGAECVDVALVSANDHLEAFFDCFLCLILRFQEPVGSLPFYDE
jgi:hypothetical protein